MSVETHNWAVFCVVLEATLANVVAELRERVVVGQVSLVWDMPGNTSSCKFGLLGFFYRISASWWRRWPPLMSITAAVTDEKGTGCSLSARLERSVRTKTTIWLVRIGTRVVFIGLALSTPPPPQCNWSYVNWVNRVLLWSCQIHTSMCAWGPCVYSDIFPVFVCYVCFFITAYCLLLPYSVY